MNLFSRSKSSYADDQLRKIAHQSLSADPMITDSDLFTIASNKGVVKVEGVVRSEREKAHIETVISHALDATGVKYDHIDNELRIV